MNPTAWKDSTQSGASNAHIYNQYGGFREFLSVHGLKIWNHEDVEEGKAIATEMRRGEAGEAAQQQHAPQQPNQVQESSSQHSGPSASPVANPPKT